MSLKCILSVLKYNNVFMYIVYMYTYASVCELITVQYCTLSNETPTVRGLAADNNNKFYMKLMIFL